MSITIRNALIVGALSTVIAGGTAASPASADQPAPTSDCVTATAQLATARADAVAARKAFTASNRPMGKLLAVERTEARAEAKASRQAVRTLRSEVATTEDKAVRRTLRAQIRAERADRRHSLRLLDSKSALRAQVKAERQAAKKAFTEAKAVRAAARSAADQACGQETV